MIEKDLRAAAANSGNAKSRIAIENCPPGHINLYPQLKEVRNQDPSQDPKCDSHLYLLQRIRAGRRPAQIARELGIPKETLQYHLNKLKAAGLVIKVGYGVWEVNDIAPIEAPKRSVKTSHVAPDKTLKCESDTVRGHAFVFTLKVPPGLRNWSNGRREEYLQKQGIAYQRLRISGGGERIFINGRKVWLTNRSVVIYEQASYFADTATGAKESALASLLTLIKKLEHLLSADFTFRVGKEYRFKVSRQHYALVRNALAEQYDREGMRLQVREPKAGHLWFIIDNSFNLHEAETVHPKTAAGDNVKVQAFFNSLKVHPITADFILQGMAGIQQNQLAFAQNISTHIQAVQELGQGVRELNRLLAQKQEVVP